MKAISHFIRQFRCRLRKLGASTAALTSAPVSSPAAALRGAQPCLRPCSTVLIGAGGMAAGAGWAARGQGAGAGGCSAWATLLPRTGRRLGTAQPQAGSAVSQLSLAAAVNRAPCLQPQLRSAWLCCSFSPWQPLRGWDPLTALLPSAPQSCCTPAPLPAPCAERTGPGLGARAGGFPASCFPAMPPCGPGAPAEPAGTSAPGHAAVLRAIQASPSGDTLRSSPPCAWPLPCPRGTACPAGQGSAEAELPRPRARACGWAGAWHSGTQLCAVRHHECTLSQHRHIQDMSQPRQERSSGSWTSRAAWQAAPAARLCRCRSPRRSAGGLQAAAPAQLRCHLADQPQAWWDPGLACVSPLLAQPCTRGAKPDKGNA